MPLEGEVLRTRARRRLSVLVMLVLGAGVLPAVTSSPATAAPDDGAFTTLRGFEPTGARVRVEPREYAASRVDLAALRGELPTGAASTVVSVPDPSGALQTFRVRRTQVMESELAAAHPEIATYAGRGVDDPRASIALDLTPMGFHAFVRAPGGGRAGTSTRPTTAAAPPRTSATTARDLPRPDKRRAEGEIDRAARHRHPGAGRRAPAPVAGPAPRSTASR